jgi:tRNA 2-thiouridine synthesizing protein A
MPAIRDSHTFDGGDLACGELLLLLIGWLRGITPGTTVTVVATDLAAPIDIPAWCHLTGHRYVGSGKQPDDRPHYLVDVSATARVTRAGTPWHLAPEPREVEEAARPAAHRDRA